MRRPEAPASWLLCAAVTVLSPRVAQAGEDPCYEVTRAVEGLLATPLDAESRLDLAPLAPARAVPRLLEIARASRGPASLSTYLALGLSRHADALKRLRALPPPPPEERVGRAVALLALGDATGSGTVAWALYEGPAELRRQTAEVLTRMRQSRPRRMLYDSLEDEDPAVRLTAAEVQVRYRSRRARRVLKELFAAGPAELRPRAARALFESSHRFADPDLARLPAELRGPAVVRAHLSSRRRNPRTLKGLLASRDDQVRAGAFAGLVAAGGITPGVLKRYAKVGVAARGAPADAQLQMALALLGEAEPLDALGALPPEVAGLAADVLWAFSQARAPYHRLDPDHAGRIAKVLEGWWPGLDDAHRARALTALFRADPTLGLARARRALEGGPGATFSAALAVIRAQGGAADARRLLTRLPTLEGRAAAEAAVTAGAVCGR